MPEPRLIDDAVLDALGAGRPHALASVYAAYGAMVYSIALRFVGSPEEAEDVLQDVFIALPESVGTLESGEAFEGWLKRVAVRTALMRQRTATRRDRQQRDYEARRPADTGSARALDRLELERAIAALPEALRRVFVLKEVEGFSHIEISRTLGISERASQQRMHRARARLRLLLGG